MPIPAAPAEIATLPALCVDLDGTLVKSDTLVDSTLALARYRPSALLKLPGWLLQGKASFKRHIAGAVQLDVVHLPYNRELLQYLEQQRAIGRPIYLATAADAATAQRVADHLGLFTGVLASDGTLNLSGNNKLAAFRQRFGDNFSYIGNATPDLPLLQNCQEPMVANPTPGLRSALRRAKITPVRTFTERVPPFKSWPKAIRLHQWAKNTLIFVPMLLAHAWATGRVVGSLPCLPQLRPLRLRHLHRQRPPRSRSRPPAPSQTPPPLRLGRPLRHRRRCRRRSLPPGLHRHRHSPAARCRQTSRPP